MLVLGRNPQQGLVIDHKWHLVYTHHENDLYHFDVRNWNTQKLIFTVAIPLQQESKLVSSLTTLCTFMVTKQTRHQIKIGLTSPSQINIVRDELLKPALKQAHATRVIQKKTRRVK